MVTIKLNSNDLLYVLAHLKAVVPNVKSKRGKTTICEITVIENKITLAVPGATFPLDCETIGTCKAAVPFLHFFEFVKDSKKKKLIIHIDGNSIRIQDVSIMIED